MVFASTLSTIEAIIPYVIVAAVVVFIVLRLVGVPVAEILWHARRRKNQHTD